MADLTAAPYVDPHTLRRISVEASRDPRVVRGVLLGRPATATSYAAVVGAVERLRLGITVPPRTGRPAPRQSEPPAA